MHKRDVVDVPIVGNQLGFRLARLNVPYGTCRIDTGSHNQRRIQFVPIKRCQWRTKFTLFDLLQTLTTLFSPS